MKSYKKLTDAQITEMEEWAEKKKKTNMSEVEQKIVNKIESMKKSDWGGCRITNNPEVITKEEAQRKLDKLKRKQ